MRKVKLTILILILGGLFCPLVGAQDKPKADPENKGPAITLRVQVTIAETEGEKKVANLPYIFFLKAGEAVGQSAPWAKVRMGSRVPIATGTEKGSTQFQYVDVGTSIDARAWAVPDGRYELALNLERSWVEGDVAIPSDRVAHTTPDPEASIFREPIIRQFKTELVLTLQDGQSIQSTQATDPLSGKTLTIQVVLNLVKPGR